MWQPTDPEVPEERFARDVRQAHPPLESRLAELVGGVEEELVCGAEAARTLRRPDDDVARLGEEPPPPLAGVDGVLESGDRVGVAAGAESRHHLEVVAVAGGDDQVVVAVPPGGRVHRPRGGVDRGGRRVREVDTVRGEGRFHREGDVGWGALAERQPDQRGVEQEPIRGRDHGHVDIAVQLVLDGQRRGQSTEVASQHDHLGSAHGYLPAFCGPTSTLLPAPPAQQSRRSRSPRPVSPAGAPQVQEVRRAGDARVVVADGLLAPGAQLLVRQVQVALHEPAQVRLDRRLVLCRGGTIRTSRMLPSTSRR